MDLFRGFKPRMHALFWVLLMEMHEHACECGKMGYSMSCRECYAEVAQNEIKAKMLKKILDYFDNDAPPFDDLIGANNMAPLYKLLRDAEKL